MSRRKRVEEDDALWDAEDDDNTDEEEIEVDDLPSKPNRKRLKQVELISDIVGDDGGEDAVNDADAGDGYESDLMGDDADRSRLAAMTEVERENELYERREARKRRDEQRVANLKARNETVTKTTDSRRRTGRNRTSDKRDGYSAILDLMARKEGLTRSKPSESVVIDRDVDDQLDEYDDTADNERSRRRRGRRGAGEDDAYEQEDDDGNDMAVDDDEEKVVESRFAIAGVRTALKLEDVKNIQLRRTALERTFNEPYFKEMAKKMFVRVTVGVSNGAAVYKMGEIVDFGEFRRSYKFANDETKMSLTLRYGTADKEFAMTAVSNHSITPEEFAKWSAEMKRVDIPIISSEEAKERYKISIHTRESFHYTPQIVAEMLEKNFLKSNTLKNVNIGSERTKLNIELSGELEKVERDEYSYEREKYLKERLNKLETVEKRLKEEAQDIQGVSVLAINKKNRESDLETMALMFGLEAKNKADKTYIPKSQKLDAFKRRATRPDMSSAFAEEEKTPAPPPPPPPAAASAEMKEEEEEKSAVDDEKTSLVKRDHSLNNDTANTSSVTETSGPQSFISMLFRPLQDPVLLEFNRLASQEPLVDTDVTPASSAVEKPLDVSWVNETEWSRHPRNGRVMTLEEYHSARNEQEEM